MAEKTPSKQRYFKKEKKQLKPKRHKAKSAAQLKAAEKKALRREVRVEELQKEESKKRLLPKLQFPNISRFITERFSKLPKMSSKIIRTRKVSLPRISFFDILTLGSFFRLSAFGNFSKKQISRAKKKNFWLSIILVVSLIFAFFLGWKLWNMYDTWQASQTEYVKVQRELTVWEHVMKEYPTYRDAYFEAAVLAYRLGKKDKEAEYLQKALSIDPNFQPALELKKLSEKTTN